MAIYIYTDTIADFSEDLAQKFTDFETLPLSYSLDDDNYDNIDKKLPIAEFYRRVEAGAKTATAMTSTFYVEERLTKALEEGKDVLALCASSKISGQYGGVKSVVESLKVKYPKRKIEAVDTMLASGGQALHCYKVLKKRDAGASFDELLEYANKERAFICSYFTCSDLKHLARLGRCSAAAAFVGTILKMMPVMYVNPIGELIVLKKVISRKKAMKAMLDKMDEKFSADAKDDKVFVTHANCIDDALVLKNYIEQKYGIGVILSDIGPVVGGHTSSGCLTVFFSTKDRTDAEDPRTYQVTY
ncbi:MAG: DegV family protein [Clostridia bacterium]|nr:DegV family protein [Clostridia bacterium]